MTWARDAATAQAPHRRAQRRGPCGRAELMHIPGIWALRRHGAGSAPGLGLQALPLRHPGRTWSGQPQAWAPRCAPGARGWRVDLALREPSGLNPMGADVPGHLTPPLASMVGSPGCPEWMEHPVIRFESEQELSCAVCCRSLTDPVGTYTLTWLSVRATLMVNNTGQFLSPRLE